MILVSSPWAAFGEGGDMKTHRYGHSVSLERYRVGPLSPYIDAFATLLLQAQYAPNNIRHLIRVVTDLSLWLQRCRTDVSRLDERTLARFLKARQRYDPVRRGDAAAVRKMLELLREQGVAQTVRPRKDSRACHPTEEDFERFLRQERRLSLASVLNIMPFVREFLDERFSSGHVALKELRAADVTGFALRRAGRLGPKRAGIMVWALRSFFRFLRLRGLTDTDLAGAVPTVPQRRWSSLPKFIDADKVEQLIKSCDRHTATGRRDHAILLLLARLGLRSGEVAALSLEDIDWQTGVICVRGKGSRIDRLPLPEDVGRALVAYLRRGRPRCATRRVFLTTRAPVGPFTGQSSVGCIVTRAVKRVGLEPAHKGAHLLRHSLATGMLRRGASLAEIGELLRHRHPDTTVIYAKVDIDALRVLAQPWPEE
jgi:site-specific recombinase XerD